LNVAKPYITTTTKCSNTSTAAAAAAVAVVAVVVVVTVHKIFRKFASSKVCLKIDAFRTKILRLS